MDHLNYLWFRNLFSHLNKELLISYRSYDGITDSEIQSLSKVIFVVLILLNIDDFCLFRSL